MTEKSKLQSIVNWLNKNYTQDNPENYNCFMGSKPGVIRYDEETAISFWGCGAIVCIKSSLLFLEEDDGHWFLREDKDDSWGGTFGYQTSFSLGWASGFADAIKNLNEYVKENGTPVYFSGIEPKVICHYTL